MLWHKNTSKRNENETKDSNYKKRRGIAKSLVQLAPEDRPKDNSKACTDLKVHENYLLLLIFENPTHDTEAESLKKTRYKSLKYTKNHGY